jgi:ribosome maturation factor RimP
MTSTSLKDRLVGLIEPLLEGLGYELVDIEYIPGRSQAMVRVYIDWPGGIAPPSAVPQTDEDAENRAFDGIGVEDCERVSREFSELLDVQDPLPGAYTLEVSSPGIDRILRTPAHYARFAGERVHVELKLPRGGRRRYTGVLARVNGAEIDLNVDGETVSMTIPEIGRTRIAPDWSRQSLRR